MAITYDPSTNEISVIGTHSFVDFSNQDKAGTLSLADRDAITGVDASPVDCDYELRPMDEVLMGGTKQDLWVTIENWVGLTSATIRLIGTDEGENAIQEDIDVNDAGTYYASDLFKTLTQTQVVAFVGSGSFDYTLVQGQWGVVFFKNKAMFIVAKIIVGDGVTESHLNENWEGLDLVRIIPTNLPRYGIIIELKDYGNFRIGEVTDVSKKTTLKGIRLIGMGEGGLPYLIKSSGTKNTVNIELYGSTVKSNGYLSGQANWKVWGCTLNVLLYMTGDIDFFQNNAGGNSALYNPSGWMIEGGYFHDLNHFIQGRYGPTITIKNCVIRKVGTLFVGRWFSGVAYLINIDTDTWAMNFVEEGYYGKVWRQNEFDVTCIDKNGPIQGVSAVGEYISPYGEAFSVSTDQYGKIPTQTVDHGFFDEEHEEAEEVKTPLTVTYSKPGYQTVVKPYPLDKKTEDRVRMHKAVGEFLDFGRPVINLKKSDPENKNVMVL